jgi:hypothetical protein
MPEFICNSCKFVTSNKKDYKKHIKTKKHYNMIMKAYETNKYICSCGNTYKYKNNLSRHQSSCNTHLNCDNESLQLKEYEKHLNNKEVLMNEIITIHKEKADLLQKTLEDKEKRINELTNEITKKQEVIISNNNNSNTVNNNQQNNTFNINITNNFVFALNEKFPHALTYNDFLQLLENSIGDLTQMANKPSFIDQISNMICMKMSELNDSDRPLHYIEGNGENSFYLKQDGQWDKTTNEEVGNKLEITAKCISKIRNNQWEDILNSGNVSEKTNDNWLKYVKHVTQEVTPYELAKNITKLKKATILKSKALQIL